VRRAYLAMTWRPGTPACVLAEAQAQVLDAHPGWRPAGAAEGLRVWTAADGAFPVSAHPDGFVIGDSFGHPDARFEPGPAGAPAATARALLAATWGQYVALLRGADGGASVLRDPSGAVGAFTWTLAPGLHVIASDPTRAPPGLGPRHPFLNWDRIGRFLAHPAAMTTDPLVDDVRAVGPGDLLDLETGVALPLWRPHAFVQPAAGDPAAAAEALVARVDHCLAALVGPHDGVLMELSGGLDSSILAGGLAAGGLSRRVRQWINLKDPRREADETRYAGSVTERIGASLTTAPWTPGAIQEADLAELASGFWPALAGVDAERDRDMAARVAATGATAILSGQGGDAAFLQVPSALVAADALRTQGLAGFVRSPVLADVARRTRRSVWSVLGEARAAAKGRIRRTDFISSLASAELRAATRGLAHPWDLAARETGLSPGKQLHVQAVSLHQVNHGASRRRRVADLLHPLAAQPVLELCLALPTPWLAGGSFDRPFARNAFADRIPQLVRDRRAKGVATVHFQKLVANSLPFLRRYLLDGVLADAGLLDRRALAHALDPNGLIWDAKARDVMAAAAVEAWVRHWQTRTADSKASAWRR